MNKVIKEEEENRHGYMEVLRKYSEEKWGREGRDRDEPRTSEECYQEYLKCFGDK